MFKSALGPLVFSLVWVAALAPDALANLVLDPDFSEVTYTGTTTGLTTLYGQFGTETGSTLTIADWDTSGYNYVYAPNTADMGTQATGANAGAPLEAPGQYNVNGYGNTYMWGPNNGSPNGLPGTPPAGVNFIAADGIYETAPITQTINGLTIGQTYVLTFYWAGAQQQGFTSPTMEWWTASLGTESFTTGTVSISGSGFSGWMQQTFYYTATGTSETLSFLAGGTPNGEPPFSLLGDVDLEVVPDFSNWLVFAGFGAMCISFEALRRRRQSRPAPVTKQQPETGTQSAVPVSV